MSIKGAFSGFTSITYLAVNPTIRSRVRQMLLGHRRQSGVTPVDAESTITAHDVQVLPPFTFTPCVTLPYAW